MGVRRVIAVTVAAAVLLPATGYATGGGPGAVGDRTAATAAPAQPFPVGVHMLALARGVDRPLPTTVWYPAAAGRTGAAPTTGAPAAAGPFPLVLFSHGLHGRPERYAALLARLAAAGFVVAAPAYPYTAAGVPVFRRADIRNQPADAAYVIERLRRLPAASPGGHLDAQRVAAVGHSAGGFTTTGMFTSGHDPRLRAGVVIAGWAAPGAFDGPAAPMLFVHGSADQVVTLESGRAAHARVTWPKAFLELPGQGHGEYLAPPDRDFATVAIMITDFLRWTLYGDATAGGRVAAGAGDAQQQGR